MLKRFAQLFLLIFVVALTPSVACADPIVITGGAFSVIWPIRSPIYSFVANNFSMNASGGDMAFNTPERFCFPCVAGAVIQPDATFIDETLGQGIVALNGSTFLNVDFFGPITFTGPSVVMPVSDAAFLTLTTPFTMSGTLGGCMMSHFICSPIVFSTEVTGSGLATIQFFSYLDPLRGRLFQFQSVTYTFENTTAPEPASIAMLLSGIATFAVAKLLRKTR
jgi:hypothetical protein